MATANRRGQCTLEISLAILVFVTILAGLYSWSDISARLFSSAVLSRSVR